MSATLAPFRLSDPVVFGDWAPAAWPGIPRGLPVVSLRRYWTSGGTRRDQNVRCPETGRHWPASSSGNRTAGCGVRPETGRARCTS